MQKLDFDNVEVFIVILAIIFLIFTKRFGLLIFFISFWYLIDSLFEKKIKDIIFFSALPIGCYFIYPYLLNMHHLNLRIGSFTEYQSVFLLFSICFSIYSILFIMKRYISD